MDCDEFLRGYSDFRDGRSAPPERRRFRGHVESCESCRRYDRVVRRGVHVLRTLPSPCSSSEEFLPRLKHRIYHIDDGIPLSGPAAGATSALTALAAVGLLALAWLPFALQPPDEVELAPVAVQPPAASGASPASASLFGSGPFLTPLLRRSGDGAAGASTADGWRTPGIREDSPIQLHGRGAVPIPAALQLR